MEKTELEPINSYYRLLVHRIARFYGIEHTIEPNRPAIMLLTKTLETKMYNGAMTHHVTCPCRPLIRLYELIDRPPPHQYVRPEAMVQAPPPPAFKIMQRGAGGQTEAVEGAKTRPDQAQPTRDYEASKARIFAGPLPPHAEPKTLRHGVSEAPSKNASMNVAWKLDAAEFDPFSSRPSALPSPPLPPAPRPIFTKPIINPEAVHLPQHIVLIRMDQVAVQSLQPFLEHLTRLLGPSWEVRTKPTYRDALLICASALQAEAVLNEPKFRVPGYATLLWKPRFYGEP